MLKLQRVLLGQDPENTILKKKNEERNLTIEEIEERYGQCEIKGDGFPVSPASFSGHVPITPEKPVCSQPNI